MANSNEFFIISIGLIAPALALFTGLNLLWYSIKRYKIILRNDLDSKRQVRQLAKKTSILTGISSFLFMLSIIYIWHFLVFELKTSLWFLLIIIDLIVSILFSFIIIFQSRWEEVLIKWLKNHTSSERS